MVIIWGNRGGHSISAAADGGAGCAEARGAISGGA